MNRTTLGLTFCVFLAGLLSAPAYAQEVLFVSDQDEPGNFDIYSMDVGLGTVRRLTCDPGIDNHADRSPDGTKVVWSSTRTNGGANPQADFEVFTAIDGGGACGLENATLTQLTSNDYPDRHPHFSHDPNDLMIIYTAKYFCVAVYETRCVSLCSVPFCITIVHPCGRRCEAMRVYYFNTGSTVDIDHDDLTAVAPAIWPTRPLTDSRWTGHPTFSDDDAQILFSGAVDGEGRNWEVYVAGWTPASGALTSLRQVTDGSTYADNPNPIKMSGGAHFGMGDATILFTSTRTEFGNSQLFEVPATADHVPVDPSIRHAATSDKANDYAPEMLPDGRIVLTSDREDYQSVNTCCGGPVEYTAVLNPSDPHTIRIEATGLSDGVPSGTRIHLDAYDLDGAILRQETVGTTYSGTWVTDTSPNASDGYYKFTLGASGEYVDLAIPSGTASVTLLLGRTPDSGVAKVYVDGVPITDGNVSLPGDPFGDASGLALHTDYLAPSSDLDLIVVDPMSGAPTNLTDSDFADQMYMIGDEVSWFCGLSPNLSLCTYLPKSLTISSLRLAMQVNMTLPDYFPNRDLYPIAYQALGEYMMSGGNGLREHNFNHWLQTMQMVYAPPGQYDDELVVLPTPPLYCIVNEQPTEPANPVNSQNMLGQQDLSHDPVTDPDFDGLTYDERAAPAGQARLLVARDSFTPTASMCQVLPGDYEWQAVARDSRGGLTYGPVWAFTTTAANAWGDNFDGYANGSGLHLRRCWVGWNNDPAADAYISDAQAQSPPHSLGVAGATDIVHQYLGATAGQWTILAHQYIPATFVSGCDPNQVDCGTYTILLNTYPATASRHWSVQLHADSISGNFIRDGVTQTTTPLATDRWVEIRVEVDLAADLYRVFYDGLEVGSAESWSAGVFGNGGGALNIAAIDLYANGSTQVFYDDLTIAAPPTECNGDANCDGAIDFDDINDFVAALSGATPCSFDNCDVNDDGFIDFNDINAFVAVMGQPCP